VASVDQLGQAATAERYLTFRLAEATYGIAILKVQEIIGLQSITRVPQTPRFVRGVINLRGRVVPVIDLCLRFAMPQAPDTERTCIVVTQVDGPTGIVTMGVIVEDVAEVVDIPLDLVEDVPEFGAGVKTEFLLGMGRLDKMVVLLLDIDKVLSAEEVVLVDRAAEHPSEEESKR